MPLRHDSMEHLVDVAAPSGEGEAAPQPQDPAAEQAAQQAYEQQVCRVLVRSWYLVGLYAAASCRTGTFVDRGCCSYGRTRL